MNADNTDVQEKVKQWLAFADEDLRLARQGMEIKSGCPYRLIAYHAQQCVEKLVKAYLVCHGIRFPYTHDIFRLLEICDQQTSTNWIETLGEAEELTSFAITTRYPGQDDEVSKDEAVWAIGIAEKVQKIVQERIK